MSAIIEASNLIKSYDGRRAVDGLDLTVQKGEFFGYLGPNGAGKTTTIRMLTGVLRPDEGTILIGGHDARDKAHVPGMIGVLSESRGFYDWMSGAEYLRFFADLYGVADADKTVAHLLESVGLSSRGDDVVGSYSRGMKQRLGLAKALVNDPEVLFLDEPTLGLDPQGQEDIQRLLKGLNKKGVTIFYSSHLLHEVSHLCSTIAILREGRLVAQGTLEDLRRKTGNSDLKDIFFTLTEA